MTISMGVFFTTNILLLKREDDRRTMQFVADQWMRGSWSPIGFEIVVALL
jgi:hypothetical protein